jgi:hypothetical protein
MSPPTCQPRYSLHTSTITMKLLPALAAVSACCCHCLLPYVHELQPHSISFFVFCFVSFRCIFLYFYFNFYCILNFHITPHLPAQVQAPHEHRQYEAAACAGCCHTLAHTCCPRFQNFSRTLYHSDYGFVWYFLFKIWFHFILNLTSSPTCQPRYSLHTSTVTMKLLPALAAVTP